MQRSYNRLAPQTRPTFVLKLFSYGQANGPLTYEPINEKARLSYSVKDIPSPPAQLRKNYTGLQARCRKEVMAGKAAQAKLEQIQTTIEEKMEELEEERSREPTPEPEQILKGPEPPREFIVEIKCEEGRHRSVAFIEELSKSIKRKGWTITVEHRDLGVTDQDEAESETESEEEMVSPGGLDPSLKKRRDKQLKKVRSASIHNVLDGE